MMLKRGVVLFLFLFYFSSVEAASVAPAKHEVNFEPGLQREVSFTFGGLPDVELELLVSGELSEYATLDRDTIFGSGKVNVNLNFPQAVEKPGRHRIRVIANPKIDSSKGQVAVVTAVRGVIDVFVPFPGKYAEIEFSVDDANAGENVNYELVVFSRGDEKISTESRIDVFDFSGSLVGSFELGTVAIESGSFFEHDSQLDVLNFEPGNYRAVALVDFGDGEQEAEVPFRLGELFVDIVNQSESLTRDRISPLEIEIESFWNDPIEGVFAEIFIGDSGEPILTPTTSLRGFERKKLTGFVDTSDIDSDVVSGKVVLHYQGKTTEKEISLELVSGEFEVNYVVFGIVVAVILVLGFAVWVFLKLKKLERRNAKK